MTIKPDFRVRLGIYRIDPEVETLRREIWELLAPRIEATISAYFDHAGFHAPFYKEAIERDQPRFLRGAVGATKALLLEPFDEDWIQHACARAKGEIEGGLDMRSRGAMAIFILTELNKLIVARHRISVRKAMRLMKAATQVFMLDVANAVACHNALEAQQAQTRADQLDSAIREFGCAIDSVRQSVDTAVKSFGSTSDQLAELASAAASQANTASEAAEDTALKVTSIVSGVSTPVWFLLD